MGLKFDWVNPNTELTKEVRIYRSSKSITELTPELLLVTLPKDSITHTDMTPAVNTVSHYCLVFVLTDGSLVKCPNQPTGYFPDGTGPGPSTISIGDWNVGYFGTLPVSDLYGADELRTALGTAALPGSGVGITNAKMTLWYKFVFEGKILFVPQGHLVTNTKWCDLYNKGLIFGIDGPGVVKVTTGVSGPVNQRVTLTKNENTYKVRTPKGLNKPADVLYPTWGVAEDLIGSEWDSIVSASFITNYQSINSTGLGKLNTFVMGDVAGNPLYWMSLTQHVVDVAGSCHIRGTTGYPDTDTKSLTGNWLPFLELEFA